MIVCDTGPLVAAALSNDRDHAACVDRFKKLHHERRERLVPATVVTEVGYLLAREAGARLESPLLRSLAEDDDTPVGLTAGDFLRMAELVETCSSLPLGTIGASVIAITKRLNLAEVATLDRRHFSVVRPSHVDALTLLP